MTTERTGHKRLPSGIKGLDTLLGGGFFAGGVYIIQGQPGAGKTVLGNQLCFNHANAGHKAVYVTLLAETHARMMLNLRSFSFFDESKVPQSISYMSAFRALEEEGLRGLLELLRREVRGRGASILLLDGLVSAEESAESPRDFKKFIHELQNQATLLGCTTFLLTSGGIGRGVRPEHTMVDGLLEMGDELHVVRSERFMQVSKFRGGSHLRGRHAFEINDDGITVHPRIEALLAEPSFPDRIAKTDLKSGSAGVDAIMNGGIPAGSATVVIGPSGIGKTTFGLQFLAQASTQEPGVFLGFYESIAAVHAKAESLGIDLAEKVKRGALEMAWQPATEPILDAVGARLIDMVKRTGARRVCIDSLGAFSGLSFHPERAVPFFAAITNELRSYGATTIWTYETSRLVGTEIPAPLQGMSPMVDNAIVLRFTEINSRLHRVISVMKKRNGAFDPVLREFTIDRAGIKVGDYFHDVEAVLTGSAHAVTATKTKRSTPKSKTRPTKRKKGR